MRGRPMQFCPGCNGAFPVGGYHKCPTHEFGVLGSIMDAVPRLTRRERRWLIHWLATKEYEADRVEEVTENVKGKRGDIGGSGT